MTDAGNGGERASGITGSSAGSTLVSCDGQFESRKTVPLSRKDSAMPTWSPEKRGQLVPVSPSAPSYRLM